MCSDSRRQAGELANLEEFLNGNDGGDPLQSDLFQDLLSADFVPDNAFCSALSTAAVENGGQLRRGQSYVPQTNPSLPSLSSGAPGLHNIGSRLIMDTAFDGLPGNGGTLSPIMMPQSADMTAGRTQSPDIGLQDMPSSFAKMPSSFPAFSRQQRTPPFETSAAMSLRQVSNSGGPATSSHNQVNSNAAEDLGARSQVEKVKETNRKAQRRYRDRQREKLAAAEDKVAELSNQLGRLQTEKDTVTASHELLARCLAIQQQQQAQGLSFITQKQSDAWWIDSKTQQLQGLTLADHITFTVWPESHIKMSQQQVVDMPLDQTAAMWRAYLTSFTDLLKAANGNEQSPAGKRLGRLWFEGMQMWGVLFTCFPDRVDAIMDKLMADEDRDAVHAYHHDAEDLRLATVVGFTQQQRSALVDLRRRLHINLGMLHRRRDILTKQLQEVIPMHPGQRRAGSSSENVKLPSSSAGSDATSGCGPEGLTLPRFCRSGSGGHSGLQISGRTASSKAEGDPLTDRRFGVTVSTMDGLKETLRDEHCCFIQGLFIFWNKILQPIQAARLQVAAFPHDARPMAIADCVAVQDGAPDNAVLLEEGAKRYKENLLLLEEALPSAMRLEFVPAIDSGLDVKGRLLRH